MFFPLNNVNIRPFHVSAELYDERLIEIEMNTMVSNIPTARKPIVIFLSKPVTMQYSVGSMCTAVARNGVMNDVRVDIQSTKSMAEKTREW